MKKIVLFSIFICLTIFANASTNISTPTVSGHWTMAGSPYNIYNDIKIDSFQALSIDPGVQVIFYGPYTVNVYGILHASGTVGSPIVFTVNDTTGFSTDMVTSAGGWHGIQFLPFGGTTSDTSILSYCNISYAKIDSLAALHGLYAIYVHRSLAIRNCNLFSNIATPALYSILFMLYSFSAGEVLEIANCNIYNNFSYGDILGDYGDYGTVGTWRTYVHDNKIYSNSGWDIFSGNGDYLRFVNNEVYQNSQIENIGGLGTICVSGVITTVKNNKIHDNTTFQDAALCASGAHGSVDIDGNLICNNQHISGTCGWIDGGGGIRVSSVTGGIPVEQEVYIRNNVIANNYSPFGGGGIYIIKANVTITNNQIINNSSPVGNGMVIRCDSYNVVTLKNNIFYGATVPENIYVGGHNSTIEFEHNWMQTYYSSEVLEVWPYNIMGDTSTNVIGTIPGLIAPTLTSTVTESALLSNFGLLPTSSCINVGDTTGAFPDPLDYLGNPRIFGSAIDIGAIEFNPVLIALHAPINSTPEKIINVFPNPAGNIFTVSTPEVKGIIDIEDLSGRVIAENTVTNKLTSFDIHAIPRGVYFAVWYDGAGNKTTQKIIAE